MNQNIKLGELELEDANFKFLYASKDGLDFYYEDEDLTAVISIDYSVIMKNDLRFTKNAKGSRLLEHAYKLEVKIDDEYIEIPLV